MNGPLDLLLFWGMVWTALGSGVFAITHWAAQRMGNAAGRHLAWTFAFLVVALLPVSHATCQRVVKEHDLPPAARENLAESERQRTAAATTPPGQGASCPSTRARPPGWQLLGHSFFGVWAAGALLTLGRGIAAWRKLHQWRARSRIFQPDLSGLPEPLLAALQPGRIELRIAVEDGPGVPITWGARRAIVLLPSPAVAWCRERLAAVLAHELGHIRRWDNFRQLFAFVVCALHWFNPLFWAAARRMKAQAELAADDAAILTGLRPSLYAAELLALASTLRAAPVIGASALTPMFQAFTVEERIRSIVNPNALRARLGPAAHAKMAVAFGFFLCALTALTLEIDSVRHLADSPTSAAECLANQA
ncbi:MAG: M56 family metallopeptidase [Verrucomicrobiota bacterium]